jgi:hypothetical protein
MSQGRGWAAVGLLLLIGGCATVGRMSDSKNGDSRRSFKYPVARKDSTVEDYHGTKVADPYRWLENPDSPEARAWIEAENKITFGFLKSIPEREKIEKRLTELWNYERFSIPGKEAGVISFRATTGCRTRACFTRWIRWAGRCGNCWTRTS